MYESGSLSKPFEGIGNTIITKDGTKIYTIEAGKGERTIVLAHGYGFTSQEWNVIVPQLVQLGYRIIGFDQRGHGKSSIGSDGISSLSMASDYKSVFEFYDIQNATLVGHSMGGFLAMKFMLSYPEMLQTRIKNCVLMATFAGIVNKDNFQNRLQIPLIKSGILLNLIKIKAIGNAFVKSLLGENPDNEVIRVFSEIFQAQNHKALIPILEAFGNENYYTQLHKITVPCTVIIGSRDKTTPPFHSEDLARLIPNSQKIVINNKGHGLNWEAPESIVQEIIALAG